MRTATGNRPAVLALALGMVLASLTGCTPWSEYVHNGFKVGPNYQKPAAPVANNWIDANDQRIRSQEDDLSHWWRVFNDPILDGLVADAYRQNLTLRQAAFRVLQARAQFGVAVGYLFPQTQQATGDHTVNAISTKTANRSFVQQRFYGQYDFGFNLSWELDLWGRLRRAIAQAADNLDASIENYDDVMVTMLGDIAAAYVQIRIYQAQIAYTRANVELQQAILTLVKARFDGGQVTELDVTRRKSVLSQTESQIPALEIGLRQTSNGLCVLLGIPPEDLMARIGSGRIPVAPPEVAIGIPADLLRRRPDVRMAERQAAAQAEQIGIAEAEFYPHFYLNGTVDYSAQAFRSLFNQRAAGELWPDVPVEPAELRTHLEQRASPGRAVPATGGRLPANRAHRRAGNRERADLVPQIAGADTRPERGGRRGAKSREHRGGAISRRNGRFQSRGHARAEPGAIPEPAGASQGGDRQWARHYVPGAGRRLGLSARSELGHVARLGAGAGRGSRPPARVYGTAQSAGSSGRAATGRAVARATSRVDPQARSIGGAAGPAAGAARGTDSAAGSAPGKPSGRAAHAADRAERAAGQLGRAEHQLSERGACARPGRRSAARRPGCRRSCPRRAPWSPKRIVTNRHLPTGFCP